MKKTLWEEDIHYHSNTKDTQKECDILIIGGGIAGVSTAYYLSGSKYSIILIDKSKVGFGMTKSTTGKITYLQGDIYHKIKNLSSEENSRLYYQSQKKAVQYLVQNIKKNNIDCDLQGVSSYTFSFKKSNNLKQEKDLLNKWKNKCSYEEKLPISFPCDGCIKVQDTYTFHPLKYLYGLKDICEKQNVLFYENILAQNITFEKDHYLCETNQGIFKCKYIVIATHYPFFIKPGFIPLKTHIEKSYVIASKNENKTFCAITNEDKTHSIRYYKDYLLYSGYNHKLGNQINMKKNYFSFKQRFQKYFKGNIDYIWSAHDIITEDYIPLIGEMKKNLFIATGFNKWGMTNGTIAGKVISDIILNKNNPYIDLFSPKRGIIFHKFIIDGFHNGKSFLKSKFISSKDVKTVKENNTSYYIYEDEEKKQHKVCKNCPHMKCSLTFNSEEKTWDCPCHGSKFTLDGDVIQGPSHKNIGKKEN